MRNERRKYMTKEERFKIFKRDNFTCQYCGRKAPDVVLEIEHIVPVTKGGDNDELNLVTSCHDCNYGKGDSFHATTEKTEQMRQKWMKKKGFGECSDEQGIRLKESLKKNMGIDSSLEYWEKIQEWVFLYSVEEVLEAIEKSSISYLKNFICSNHTKQEKDFAFNKIPAICYNARFWRTDSQPYFFYLINQYIKSTKQFIPKRKYVFLKEYVRDNIETKKQSDEFIECLGECAEGYIDELMVEQEMKEWEKESNCVKEFLKDIETENERDIIFLLIDDYFLIYNANTGKAHPHLSEKDLGKLIPVFDSFLKSGIIGFNGSKLNYEDADDMYKFFVKIELNKNPKKFPTLKNFIRDGLFEEFQKNKQKHIES